MATSIKTGNYLPLVPFAAEEETRALADTRRAAAPLLKEVRQHADHVARRLAEGRDVDCEYSSWNDNKLRNDLALRWSGVWDIYTDRMGAEHAPHGAFAAVHEEIAAEMRRASALHQAARDARLARTLEGIREVTETFPM